MGFEDSTQLIQAIPGVENDPTLKMGAAILGMHQMGFWGWLGDYIKNAWQGKVSFLYLFVFGFWIIPDALNFIAKTIPALEWPIAIFEIPLAIWWYVAAWRCAFNGTGRKWAGYGARVFLVLPVLGLLFIAALDIRQGIIVGLECAMDQASYNHALETNNNPEFAKSILDACMVKKDNCLKHLDACRKKYIP